VMFTPHQERAARELMRVVKSGGKIGMANWTPESLIGQLFKTLGQYLPPAAGVKSPALWGNPAHLEMLFSGAASITTTGRHFAFRYKSPEHMLEIFRTFYGPVHKAFGALDAEKQKALEADILALMNRFNIAKDGTLVAMSEYLEVVVVKK